eukprot:7390791-Prymnesium_polylepis.1
MAGAPPPNMAGAPPLIWQAAPHRRMRRRAPPARAPGSPERCRRRRGARPSWRAVRRAAKLGRVKCQIREGQVPN